MEDIIWKKSEVKEKITDPQLLEILWRVMPIYLTSDFFLEVARLGGLQDVTVTGMGSFAYRNRVLFQFVPKTKVELTKEIYECCRKTGRLADYGFAVVDNRSANRFSLTFLSGEESFDQYLPVPEPAELSLPQREELFRSFRALAEEGIFVPLHSVSVHKTTGEFRLFDFSKIIANPSVDGKQKEEYLEFHRKILLGQNHCDRSE